MKQFFAGVLAVVLLAGCSGSGSGSSGTGGTATGTDGGETVALTVWGSKDDQEFLNERIEAFKQKYAGNTFEIEVGVESEANVKATVLADPEGAADVFLFIDDQLTDLAEAGALHPLDDDMDAVLKAKANTSVSQIRTQNTSLAVSDATYKDMLYGFPISADNGYFLYYDSTVFSEEDVADWDSLLAKAAQAGNGRKVGMTLDNGWYNAGFFYGAGFLSSRNDDGTTNLDWNGTSPSGVKGSDVVLAMSRIAQDPSFQAVPDGEVSDAVASGELCAVVSGTWDAKAAQEAFGSGYAASILPKFKAGDHTLQQGSAAGCKLVGVNSHCQDSGWAMLLAEFLSNEESQIRHYEMREICPSNINAQRNETIEDSIAISAVLEQMQYAVIQKVGNNYWEPSKAFGEAIVNGEITDEASAQAALDELVTAVGKQ